METTSVKGYYNDLRLKARWTGKRDSAGIPISKTSRGKEIYFPTTILQYGLGHHDLWLENQMEEHYKEFVKVAGWLLGQQDELGGWDVFGQLDTEAINKHSAMTQGQASSLLLRAFLRTKDEQYLDGAKKAVSLMLTPILAGGTALCRDEDLFLEEMPSKRQTTVLNGWIFAVFGLWDYALVTSDPNAEASLAATISTLERHLGKYDRGYWSNYDWSGAIASPFYQKLHIALLQALYALTGKDIFCEVAERWTEYDRSLKNKAKAVSRKVWEKLQADREIVRG